MTRKLNPPVVDLRDHVLPVIKGGTGSNTVQGANASLGIVTQSQKNTANGPVGLDAQGKMSSAVLGAVTASEINISGSLIGYVLTPLVLTIVDFDSFKTYDLSCSSGTVTRNGATITYTPSATPGPVTLTINTRQLTITVNDSQPAKPAIQSPTSGSINASLTPTLQSSAFVSLGVAQTHSSSDWQIATDAAFTNIVSQTNADATNKTSWVVPSNLGISTVYHARVRYRSSNGSISAWSDTISFTTRSDAAAQAEEAKIVAANRTTNAYFGFSVDITADGSRVIVASISNSYVYVFARSGASWAVEFTLSVSCWHVTIDATGTRMAIGTLSGVTIYRRSGTTWTLEQAIAGSGQMGISVDFDENADRLVAGANTIASVLVYVRNNTTWTLEQTIAPGSFSGFGAFTTMSGDGTRFAAAGYAGSTAAQAGRVLIYARSGSTWTLERTLNPTTTSIRDDYFGGNMAFSTDSTRLLVSARYNDTAAGGLTDAGCVYVYSRSGTTWTQEAVLVADNPAASALFGQGADMSGDGTIIAVGSNSSGTGNICTLYIFTRTGTTWSLLRKIRPSDTVAGDMAQISESYTNRLVAVARTNSRIIYGASLGDVSGTSDAGAAYIMA